MRRKASVYYRDRLAGTLAELSEGDYRFTYDPAYLENGLHRCREHSGASRDLP